MAMMMADGQLSSSSATILGTAASDRTVGVVLYNTSSVLQQTVRLTITRSGSAARTLVRAVLEGNESLYLAGLTLDPSDLLAGLTTNAATVDYLVTTGLGPFSVTTRDKAGAPKASAALEVTLPKDLDINEGTLRVIGLLEEVRDVLLKIA